MLVQQNDGRTRASRIAAVCAALAALAAPQTAHAYLDPGTGSMVLQVILASVMGGLFVLKRYWHRLKARFGGTSPRGGESPAERSRADGERD